MAESLEQVYKVVLGSGKIVHLRKLKIKHQDLAMQNAGSSENQLLFASRMQRELLKLLIVDIDGKKPKPMDLEDLDNIFEFEEYTQLTSVLSELTGGNAPTPKREIVSFGSK